MIKAIIVDDEQHCISRLTRLLEENCAQTVEVIGVCTTGKDGFEKISNLKPDLVFMDIQLGESTGIDLLKQIGKIDFEVIFTTAYDNYAIQAFKFSAIDYLLKPVEADELSAAVQRLRHINDQKQLADRLQNLFQNLKGGSTPARISVPTNNGLVFLNVQDITRCEADVNYTTIYLKDKSTLTVAKTLKDFDQMLSVHQFFRIHSAHLINLQSVKSYHRGKGGYVIMNDNTSLEVSSRRKDLFLQKMAEL
jgi:two-component system LytT family response regulator